jgi:hypothetical protein
VYDEFEQTSRGLVTVPSLVLNPVVEKLTSQIKQAEEC